MLHIIFTFIFCKWLVCCLTGFYRPNRDDDDDDDDDDDEDDEDDNDEPSCPLTCRRLTVPSQ